MISNESRFSLTKRVLTNLRTPISPVAAIRFTGTTIETTVGTRKGGKLFI